MKRQSKSTGTTSGVDPKIKLTSSSQRLVAPLACCFFFLKLCCCCSVSILLFLFCWGIFAETVLL
ncbi:hypothetical protein RchiOBHm_Chr6g0264481 [Rosa chinensis]|uniref:Uncharacterized protein n=1 Tax=Rosa chinensis TaxID=74649 RepID=A0A2P6PP75_ROSCH|nr:hypothetical protein RchiOBHm_Chr6g0264481 [Rosa chinensis]